MYATCFLFLMMWLGYVWAWSDVTPKGDSVIEVRAPILKQSCDAQEIACIDDCSFLCVEPKTKCIGGVCQVEAALRDIECNEKTGGVRMMVKDPVPHWTCVCSDSRFYGGDACNVLHPDVCEHGTFFYLARRRYVCICPPPYELLKIDSKPHCVQPQMMGFYDEATMSRSLF